MKLGLWQLILLVFLFVIGCSESSPDGDITDPSTSQRTVISSNESISESLSPTPTPSPETIPTRPFHLLGTIEILNMSEFATEILEDWVSSSKALMEDQDSNVLIVIYPVGEFRNNDHLSEWGSASHEVIISPAEITDLLTAIDEWFSRDACMARNIDLKNSELGTYREYLESGAALKTQVMLCQRTRLILMGLPVSSSIDDHEIPFRKELYHAFQHDVGDSLCTQRSEITKENNSDWMVEGGAYYFAAFLGFKGGSSANFKNSLLESALRTAKSEGTDINRGSIHIKGAAGLLLLVKQGWLNEEMIFDGTLFQNCRRETDYGFKTPEIRHIKNTWHLIQEKDGAFIFLEEAIGP